MEAAVLQANTARQEAASSRAANEAAASAASKRERELLEDAEKAKQCLLQDITRLKAELESLEEFGVRRAELEAEAQQAQQDHQRMVREYEEKLGELHLRAHRLGQRVEQLEREAAEQAAAAGAADETEADPVRLLQQNRKLAAGLRKAGEESARLTAKLDEAQTTIGELRAAADVSKGVENAAVESSSKQVRHILKAPGVSSFTFVHFVIA